VAANPNPPTSGQRLAELAALVDAVKKRVREHYPQGKTPPGTVCVGLPDLTPLARARDAALGKMAAIGSVNPRRGGALNNSIQAVKRIVARSLNWFVRDQIVFNRQIVACVETTLETLSEVNQTIHALALQVNRQIQVIRAEAEPLRTEAAGLRAIADDLLDLRSHWNRWREEWQLKLHDNEVEFLKSVADLNLAGHQRTAALEAVFQDRLANLQAAIDNTLERIQSLDAAYGQTAANLESSFRGIAAGMESDFRQALRQTESAYLERIAAAENSATLSVQEQHDAFEDLARANAEAIQRSTTDQIAALAEERRQWSIAMEAKMADHAAAFEKSLAYTATELQKKFYGDLDRIRSEYERIIHAELRVVRQRLAAAPPPQTAPAAPSLAFFDYARFSDRFRGSEEYVTESQRFYLPWFTGRRHVLDLGCGRGEFLNLLRESGVPARGIEAGAESVAYCRSQGLEAEQADLFVYLSEQPEASLDGIFCSQVVEHLPPERLPELVRLCATRLTTGGVLAIETPNPECLAIFATHFYLDPTHTRPVPSQLLAFYMEEFGLGRIEVHRKAQAVETIPELGELAPALREKLFGGLDYAIVAWRL
jgi:O-antigen chain-terminating methyltransferase